MMNEFLIKIKNSKSNSDIIDVIIDIYFSLKFNPEVQEEFESIAKTRPFEDSYIEII